MIDASKEFERRLGDIAAPRGEKQGLILNAVSRAARSFNIADLQRECPGVSVDMIRHVLKKLRANKQVECLGRGRNAVWQKTSGRIG
jgi:hypothetical protein